MISVVVELPQTHYEMLSRDAADINDLSRQRLLAQALLQQAIRDHERAGRPIYKVQMVAVCACGEAATWYENYGYACREHAP